MNTNLSKSPTSVVIQINLGQYRTFINLVRHNPKSTSSYQKHFKNTSQDLWVAIDSGKRKNFRDFETLKSSRDAAKLTTGSSSTQSCIHHRYLPTGLHYLSTWPMFSLYTNTITAV